MTRLGFLRMMWALIAGTSTRGYMSQRPDQVVNAPPPTVAPSQAAGVPVRTRQVIISGTSGVIGLFEYSGLPSNGNPPIGWAVAPGTTKDPFGNTLPASGGFATISSPAIAQLFNGLLNVGRSSQFAGTGGASPAAVGLNATNDVGTLQLLSGISSSTDVQAAFVLKAASASGAPNQSYIEAGSPLVLAPIATPANTQIGAQLWADSNGYPRAQVNNAGDTNNYFLAQTFQQVSPRSQTISATAPGNIGGLSLPVGIGTYLVTCRMIIQWSSAVGGIPQMRFAGPTVSQFDVSFKSQQSGSNSTTNNANTVSAAAGNGTGYNGATLINQTVAMTSTTVFFDLDIWGMFTFTASGTLTLQAATSVANENFIVLSGFWKMIPVL